MHGMIALRSENLVGVVAIHTISILLLLCANNVTCRYCVAQKWYWCGGERSHDDTNDVSGNVNPQQHEALPPGQEIGIKIRGLTKVRHCVTTAYQALYINIYTASLNHVTKPPASYFWQWLNLNYLILAFKH